MISTLWIIILTFKLHLSSWQNRTCIHYKYIQYIFQNQYSGHSKILSDNMQAHLYDMQATNLKCETLNLIKMSNLTSQTQCDELDWACFGEGKKNPVCHYLTKGFIVDKITPPCPFGVFSSSVKDQQLLYCITQIIRF